MLEYLPFFSSAASAVDIASGGKNSPKKPLLVFARISKTISATIGGIFLLPIRIFTVLFQSPGYYAPMMAVILAGIAFIYIWAPTMRKDKRGKSTLVAALIIFLIGAAAAAEIKRDLKEIEEYKIEQAQDAIDQYTPYQ